MITLSEIRKGVKVRLISQYEPNSNLNAQYKDFLTKFPYVKIYDDSASNSENGFYTSVECDDKRLFVSLFLLKDLELVESGWVYERGNLPVRQNFEWSFKVTVFFNDEYSYGRYYYLEGRWEINGNLIDWYTYPDGWCYIEFYNPEIPKYLKEHKYRHEQK